MINIPLIDNRSDFDCCNRFYRRAIYNTLLELKPKHSFEIGSYTFQSSSVWSAYYDQYDKNGLLITCDIAEWVKSPPPEYVFRSFVYPHIDKIEDNHGGINIHYKDWRNHVQTSVSDNIRIIKDMMIALSVKAFDLSFVDGDHAEESFLKDLLIAQHLTKEDGYILIDDIRDENHVQAEIYRKLKENGNVFYEYEDWNPNPGMALIQAKDLIL